MSKLKRLERFARWLTWCAVLALAILSWTPAEDMVRPGWGHYLEHVTAYFISGAIAALGYGRRRGYATVGVLLCGYAGFLEIGQNWSPGRSPAFDDFAASAMGALLGTALAWLWLIYFGRGRPTIC
jgi:VanZ family protein